jgi:hypothetical protein
LFTLFVVPAIYVMVARDRQPVAVVVEAKPKKNR